jgi:DMSO/TMAO reductase YedYZ molybdopterin-dependent catalytic subunit
MIAPRALRAAWRSPPGPFRPGFWRSPLRGPWITALFGSVLLVGVTILFVTGLLSYAAYNPNLPTNDTTADHGLLGVYLFTWPAGPAWLYRLNQGVHVTLGLVLIPVLLGKLWSVIPRLFIWPPARSLAQVLERLSLLLLVGGAGFEFLTGVLNIQYVYAFPGTFYQLHLYGAWVFIAAFVAHVGLRFPVMVRSLRLRRITDVLRADLNATDLDPEGCQDEPGWAGRVDPGLVSPAPAEPTMSRRGLLGLIGGASFTILGVTVGQSLGGSARQTALLAPRDVDPQSGPNGFQINKTALGVGVTPAQTGPTWRLAVQSGGSVRRFSRAQLLAMAQHDAVLPIACVEGWSTGDQRWTGIRLADLARLSGLTAPASRLYVRSLERHGAFNQVTLAADQVAAPDALLALRVNGADLSPDHGYPARLIIPAAPGVHNTKWVSSMEFFA